MPLFSDIDIKPVYNRSKLKAIVKATITGGIWIIRGIKINENPDKSIAVYFPSQPYNLQCAKCRESNSILSKFCGACGIELPEPEESPGNFYKDLVFCATREQKNDAIKEIRDAYYALTNRQTQ